MNKWYSTQCIRLLLANIVLLFSCTTMTLNEFPEVHDEQYTENEFLKGISTFTMPMSDPEDNLRYFGLNLMEKGIIPIYLSIKNTVPDRFYTIKSDSIKVGNIGQIDKSFNPAKDKFDKAEELAPGGAIFIGFGITSISLASEATAIKENLDSKKFRSQTIEPGEKASGFCYFKIEEMKANDELGLYIELQEAHIVEPISIILPIDLRK